MRFVKLLLTAIMAIGTYRGPRGAVAAQPIKLWNFTTGNGVESSPALSSDGKVVYVGSSDNYLYAINTVDGSKSWGFPTNAGIFASPTLSSDGKVVYIRSSGGGNSLFAVNTVDGSQKWECLPSDGYSSPALSSDGKVVYVGSVDKRLHAINTVDGSKNWSFLTNGSVFSPALSSDGKVVYVGSSDNNTNAINTVDGSKIWSFPTGGEVLSSPALSSDGKVVYVGSQDANLYAVDAVNGSKIWSFQTGSHVDSSPAVSSDGKVVYVGSDDLYAINTVDGSKLWNFSSGNDYGLGSSPTLSSDGKVVYVGGSDSNVYAIDAQNGIERWNFPTGNFVDSSPLLSSDGKVVYVGSADNNLYAIVDNCYQETCSSHGTCVNRLTGYTCDCTAGFIGKDCGAVDNCYNETCSSHGTCVNNHTGYTCDCTPGFMGKDCAAINYCYHETCSSHGSCHNTLNAAVNEFGPYLTSATTHGSLNSPNRTGFTCDCDAGYTGITCQNTYCTGQLCSHHGRCVNGTSSYTCSCTHGYFGKSCSWHLLPPYAYGVVGGVLVAVVACWLFFCRRKPSNTYDLLSYSQIQQQPALDVGTRRYNEATESNYGNLPTQPQPRPSGSFAPGAGRTSVGMAVRQCRQCNTRAPSSGTERFCRSCGAAAVPLVEENARGWSVDEVCLWATANKLAPELFRENDIDGAVLLELDDDMLKDDLELTSKLKRTKITARVALLKKKAA